MGRRTKLSLIFCIVSILFSCNEFEGTGEGTVIYEVAYDPAQKAEKAVIGVLPTKMTQVFKDGNSKCLIKPMLSMFAYISDSVAQTNYILFQLWQDRSYCESPFDNPTIGFDEFPGLKLTYTDETKEIAGYSVRKVIAEYNGEEPYDIWYTTDIKISNPNWYNPYSEIKGVLLDYKVSLAGIKMHIKAKEIISEEISDKEFTVDSEFKKVDCLELKKKVDDILSNE